jgi:hypothetical protein
LGKRSTILPMYEDSESDPSVMVTPRIEAGINVVGNKTMRKRYAANSAR